MKKIGSAVLLAALLASTAVLARSSSGFQIYNEDRGTLKRLDTPCLLEIDGEVVHNGYCDVERIGLTTRLTIDGVLYKIVRNEEDDLSGEFYRRGSLLDDNIEAKGSCWKGPRIKYCAR